MCTAAPQWSTASSCSRQQVSRLWRKQLWPRALLRAESRSKLLLLEADRAQDDLELPSLECVRACVRACVAAAAAAAAAALMTHQQLHLPELAHQPHLAPQAERLQLLVHDLLAPHKRDSSHGLLSHGHLHSC